ncbi:hypothetical protein MXB_5596 [Myxobolus squamalis]|nr:hypothetical protein MXB_5596 [Myxobolus squamalis]
MIGFGKTIGFATPRTLFDTSDMIITGTKGDLAVLKPNIIITVPLLLERIKNKVIEKVQCQSRLKRLIFQTCYFIGGSCIPRNIEEFANICFGKFKQGYANYNPTGTTGAMLTNARIKLLPWVEGNYCPDDKPYPRGEISVSGDCLASGYYKNKKLTNSCFHVDKQTGIRWFDTGDIGMITSDGSLKIIDRKKDIIKLSQGEYISLVQIESKISECPLVELNCVLPNKSMQHLVALIIPNRDKVEQYLIHNNIIKSGCDIDKLLEKKSICSQLSDEVKIFIINCNF